MAKYAISEAGRELATYLDARHHVIAIRTPEERRVVRDALAYADTVTEKFERSGMKVFIWTFARGLVDRNWKPVQTTTGMTKGNPGAALDYAGAYEGNAIFVLYDLHPFLPDPGTVRQLKDLEWELSNVKGGNGNGPTNLRYVLFTGANFTLPSILEDSVTLLDFGLPTMKELENVVMQAMEQLPAPPEGHPSSQRVAAAGAGLTERAIRHAILHSASSCAGKIDPAHVASAKQQAIEKSGVLTWIDNLPKPEDIGGLENLTTWLKQRERAFFDMEAREKYQLPAPRGVLMVGIPGCGKSLACKAAGSMWGLPILRLDVGRLMDSQLGASEANMRRAIEVAEINAPIVLWIDEIEKGISGTESSGKTDGGTTARMFASLLTWMEEKTEPVFIAATANNISQLPPEMLRKGRFDEIFFVDLPTLRERNVIWRIHLAKRRVQFTDGEVSGLAKESSGFSGAEIEAVVEASLFTACYAEKPIDSATVLQEIKDTTPLSKSMGERIKGMQDWAGARARFATPKEEEADKDMW